MQNERKLGFNKLGKTHICVFVERRNLLTSAKLGEKDARQFGSFGGELYYCIFIQGNNSENARKRIALLAKSLEYHNIYYIEIVFPDKVRILKMCARG